MKRVTLRGVLILLLLTFSQFVATAPGSGGKYVFELKWGSSGSGDGLFNMPRGTAIDSNGNVYVADTSNHRIQKFDSEGGFLGWIGLDNLGNTGWHNPETGTRGVFGYGDGQFRTPWGLAIDSDGNIYVADTLNNRIQKLDSSGVMLGWWGLDNSYVTGWHDPGSGKIGYSGTGDGQLWLPYDVTVDSEGNVYVVDSFNHRIQKFDSDGGFLGWIGRDNLGFSGWHNPGTGTRGVLGTGDGQFRYPWGVDVDSNGNVFVADTSNQRYQKLDADGVFLGWWGFDYSNFTGWHPPGTLEIGRVGTGDGQFWNPYDVAVDLEDNVFVVDTFMRRIQKFDLVPPLGVTSPNGEEVLIANTTHEITWEPGVGNDFVRIEFSVDNGTNWEEIVASTENNGSYDWTVPCNLSAECLVLISGTTDYFFDESDDVFSIESDTPPVITLNGESEIVLECGIGDYEEPGATAVDGCGDNVPVDIGGDTVTTTICGEYTITYYAIDASGQAADPKTRSVIVRDTTPPDPDVKPLLPVSGECSRARLSYSHLDL
jgi:sugar lactone lactonase YvrE